MKKLFLIISLIACFAFTVKAQKVVTFTNDTITNAGTATLTTGKILGNYTLSVHVLSTELSGTAAGSGVLQSSIDGTNFATILTFASTADSMTVDDGTTFVWNTVVTPDLYYRVLFTGSGTESTKVTGSYLIKPIMTKTIK